MKDCYISGCLCCPKGYDGEVSYRGVCIGVSPEVRARFNHLKGGWTANQFLDRLFTAHHSANEYAGMVLYEDRVRRLTSLYHGMGLIFAFALFTSGVFLVLQRAGVI